MSSPIPLSILLLLSALFTAPALGSRALLNYGFHQQWPPFPPSPKQWQNLKNVTAANLLTDDLSQRPDISGYTFIADNKWSPDGDLIPGACDVTWQQCADLCSRTPNAAGFVYQDWALQGSKNCCFLKFDIKTPPGPDGEKPLDNSGLVPPSSGQTSVIYAKTGYPPESSNGFDLVGAYESSGNDIGQANWVGQTLGDCLWDCSQKSGCVGAVYRHDKGNNNSPTCYFKSKIAESAGQWTDGNSGFLYALPAIAAAIPTAENTITCWCGWEDTSTWDYLEWKQLVAFKRDYPNGCQGTGPWGRTCLYDSTSNCGICSDHQF